MHRCAASCRSLDPVQLALPAGALRDNNVAKWVRDHGTAVAVRDIAELSAAIGAGTHPLQMVAHGDGFSADELVFCSAGLGVGRVVANSPDQVQILASCIVRHRRQRVILGTTDADVVAAARQGPRLDLVGVHRYIDSSQPYLTAYPETVGDLIGDMANIRHTHDVVLTRVLVGGGCGLSAAPDDLADVAHAIEIAVDDACATLRFPRPVVVIAPGRRAGTPSPGNPVQQPGSGHKLSRGPKMAPAPVPH